MENTKTSLTKRIGAFAAAALIASCMAAPMAFADAGSLENGQTSLIVKISDKEVASTSDSTVIGSEDVDPYSTTGNVTFTIPTQINYTMAQDGTLTQGTTAANRAITNTSTMPIHVSSMKVTPEADWSFVATSTSTAPSSGNNQVALSIFGTDGDASNETAIANTTMDASAYSTKSPVARGSVNTVWDMAAVSGTPAAGGHVTVSSSGKMFNVNTDITSDTTFGKITWYVKAGNYTTA